MFKLRPGQWFVADIIGHGIYELVEYGINRYNCTYAIVKCKKIFLQGNLYKSHETTCHPITPERWNTFKILK